jgi:hypothetical protein
MSTTEPQHDHTGHDGEPPTAPVAAPVASPAPSVLDQVGGVSGFVYSTIPVLVFVTANVFLPLPTTTGIALVTGLALTVIRLVRGERFALAVGSLFGVAVAAAIVAWTGSAKDFFAIGIWISLVGFVVFSGSVLLRRPLTGTAWSLAHGRRYDWRADPPSLRAHDVATLATAATFGARFVVQQWLYLADTTTALGIARVAMGTPLSVLSALVFVWAYRRTTKRLLPTTSRGATRTQDHE